MPRPATSVSSVPREGETAFVLRHVRLVVHMARRTRKQIGGNLDDLIADGMYGLFIAARKYDPSRGFRETTLAGWYIRGYMLRKYDRQRPEQFSEGKDMTVRSREPNPAVAASWREVLDGICRRLSDRERDLLMLLLEDNNQRDIAVIQGKSYQAVQDAIGRLRDHVRLRCAELL
jgi:RNA polymerase sigma factor (sigma-70 family)